VEGVICREEKQQTLSRADVCCGCESAVNVNTDKLVAGRL
jgi:hypothetical protein